MGKRGPIPKNQLPIAKPPKPTKSTKKLTVDKLFDVNKLNYDKPWMQVLGIMK